MIEGLLDGNTLEDVAIEHFLQQIERFGRDVLGPHELQQKTVCHGVSNDIGRIRGKQLLMFGRGTGQKRRRSRCEGAYGASLDLFEQSLHGRMREGEFTNEERIHEDASGPDVGWFAAIRALVHNLRCWTDMATVRAIEAGMGRREVS